jgi:1-deoxy-D-xylulose-5-phosphate reductoisomerase
MKHISNVFPASVSVLGSTGSVGTQALEVIGAHRIPVDLLTANANVALAEEQIRAFSPRVMVMASETAATDLRARVADTPTKVLGSQNALLDAVHESRADTVIHSILGEAGLSPLLAAIEEGKRIGLANKESLVIAGDIVMKRAKESGAVIVPVDSEHSAIFQCIDGAHDGEVRKILLTASGGPFFGYSKEDLKKVTKAQTLAHPTWKMGAKITVDSATLMNKGFEVIEAVRLFGVAPAKIEVVVHRESIIHSAVEYIDSAVIAQMGAPDMRLCVQYALTYPHRAEGLTKPLSLSDIGRLTFYKPDTDTFPLLGAAFDAISAGGGVPAALNAANEIAVDAFLNEKLSFFEISEAVLSVMAEMGGAKVAQTLEDRILCDREARERARAILTRKHT